MLEFKQRWNSIRSMYLTNFFNAVGPPRRRAPIRPHRRSQRFQSACRQCGSISRALAARRPSSASSCRRSGSATDASAPHRAATQLGPAARLAILGLLVQPSQLSRLFRAPRAPPPTAPQYLFYFTSCLKMAGNIMYIFAGAVPGHKVPRAACFASARCVAELLHGRGAPARRPRRRQHGAVQRVRVAGHHAQGAHRRRRQPRRHRRSCCAALRLRSPAAGPGHHLRPAARHCLWRRQAGLDAVRAVPCCTARRSPPAAARSRSTFCARRRSAPCSSSSSTCPASSCTSRSSSLASRRRPRRLVSGVALLRASRRCAASINADTGDSDPEEVRPTRAPSFSASKQDNVAGQRNWFRAVLC